MSLVYEFLSAPTVQTKFDAATMAENPQLAMETGMVDDGSGTKTVQLVCACLYHMYTVLCYEDETPYSTSLYDMVTMLLGGNTILYV